MSAQIIELLYSFAFGLIPGAVFDIFRAVRAAARKSSLLVNIADLMYWLMISAILFLFGISVLTEGFRWHILLGICAGIIVYFFAFSKVARKLLFTFANNIAGIIKTIKFLCKKIKIKRKDKNSGIEAPGSKN